jgi:hypothetical protein
MIILAARKHFANHIRISLRPEVFFKIPFEVLEMTHTYPNETEEEAANRLVEAQAYFMRNSS